MNLRKKRGLIAALAALSLAVAGCSGSPAPEAAQGDGTRLGNEDKSGKGKGRGDGNRKGPGNGKKRGDGGRRGGSATSGGPGAVKSPDPAGDSADAPPGSSLASEGPPSPVDPSLANRSSFVDDANGDAQKEGVVPSHGEMIRAGIQGRGSQFEMRLTFAGNVPEKMPDDKTVMVIGFGISAGGNDTYGFTAQGSHEGWKAFAGAKDSARKFPGEFIIDGDTIIMRAPWSFIDGPREFRWQTNSTWFRTIANTTHYSFDQCPNEKAAEFPS